MTNLFLTCADYHRGLSDVPLYLGHRQSRPVHVTSGRTHSPHDVRYSHQSVGHMLITFPRYITHCLPVPLQLGKTGKSNYFTVCKLKSNCYIVISECMDLCLY